jgi:hypothetical protein
VTAPVSAEGWNTLQAELLEGFRRRLCSGFSMFSDAEIEEGIKKVETRCCTALHCTAL